MKNALSITALLVKLLNSAPKPEPVDNEDDKEKKGTTIRFTKNTLSFIESNAEHLGISAQQFVSMTMTSVKEATVHPQYTELQLMLGRFVSIFSSHGIPVSDIPVILDNDISRSDLLSDQYLLNKLDDALINKVATLFSVQPGYLKGLDSTPHKSNYMRWYKNISNVARRLAVLSHENRSIRVLFIAEQGSISNLYSAKNRSEE
ncbi:MAG: hypothetical protein QM500_12440, partial [Methylococcales bacterium]